MIMRMGQIIVQAGNFILPLNVTLEKNKSIMDIIRVYPQSNWPVDDVKILFFQTQTASN